MLVSVFLLRCYFHNFASVWLSICTAQQCDSRGPFHSWPFNTVVQSFWQIDGRFRSATYHDHKYHGINQDANAWLWLKSTLDLHCVLSFTCYWPCTPNQTRQQILLDKETSIPWATQSQSISTWKRTRCLTYPRFLPVFLVLQARLLVPGWSWAWVNVCKEHRILLSVWFCISSLDWVQGFTTIGGSKQLSKAQLDKYVCTRAWARKYPWMCAIVFARYFLTCIWIQYMQALAFMLVHFWLSHRNHSCDRTWFEFTLLCCSCVHPACSPSLIRWVRPTLEFGLTQRELLSPSKT